MASGSNRCLTTHDATIASRIDAPRRDLARKRPAIGIEAAIASCLVAACGSGVPQAANVVDNAQQARDAGSAGPNAATVDLSRIEGTGGAGDATPAQRQWLAQAAAFMNRPEQQRDVRAALQARASTHPAFCPAATFAPKRIDVAFDPAPQFSDDGTMTRGTVVYRATMQGCSIPVLLTIYLDVVPGLPLRFRAGLAGTTFADPDLQERAIPVAADVARALLPGCARTTPVDTRLIGGSPSARGRLVPWSEHWLMAGCGRLVGTKLDFTPDPAANRMMVRADPAGSRLLQAGAVAGDAGGIGTAARLPSTRPDAASGKVVAAAIGTSLIPLGGADIPAAKVAGTCLSRLRESEPATAPDHVECLAGLSPRAGATTVCSASRGEVRSQMHVAITDVDGSAGSVKFECRVRAP